MISERAQIRKVLEYQTKLAKRVFAERRGAIYAGHSAKGCLRSGSTIRAVVRLMEDVSSALVSNSIEKISPVAQDADAFADISAALGGFWSYLEAELPSTLNIASGRQPHEKRKDAAAHSAMKIFEKSRYLVNSKLELYRSTFTKQSVASGVSSPPATAESRKPPSKENKKGGRPPAEFWDDMWAAIAVSLYTGDFQPKSQADVQRAMLAWIDANDHTAADSTVKSRARRLWDRISALDE